MKIIMYFSKVGLTKGRYCEIEFNIYCCLLEWKI